MEEQERPPKLDYVTPQTMRSEVSKGQVVGGAMLSVMVIALSVPVAFAMGYANQAHSGAVFWGVVLVAVAALNAAAFAARGSRRWRGLAQGLWIGLGIAVLLEGVCFLIMAA
jgi:hypothetical protein